MNKTSDTPFVRETALPLLLDRLPELSCAVIVEVTADSEDIQRLKAMGICAGRKIELIQQGDPLILRVYGTRLGISRRLATFVRVTPCERIVCPHFLS